MNLGDKTRILSVRLNDELAAFVASQAKEMNVRPSDYIRILLRVGLAMEKSDAAKAAEAAAWRKAADAGVQEAKKILSEIK